MKTSADKIRVGGSKVRSGCLTCKRRRVKCDEARPGCRKCAKSSRLCEGYASTSPTTKSAAGHRFIHYVDPHTISPGSSPSLNADLDDLALRSLDFFHHYTAPQLEQPFSVHLWLQGLSTLMYSEPTVKYGLVALAALHENFRHASKSISVTRRRVLALEYYGKSIHNLVQLNARNVKDAIGPNLVTSLLYCAIESIQGHFSSALRHITAAVRLLSEQDDSTPGLHNLPHDLLVAVRRVFIDLGIQAIAIGNNEIREIMPQFLLQSSSVMSYGLSSIERGLAEIAHILAQVTKVLAWIESTHQEPNFPCFELRESHQTLLQRYHQWTRTYTQLPEINQTFRATDVHHKHIARQILCMNQVMTGIALGVEFSRDETRFDSFTDDFEIIVDAAEEVLRVESKLGDTASNSCQRIFSMNLGVIPALFFTCVRCRHRTIRRRALSAIKASRRREMVWDSATVAAVAEQVIDIEEKAAMQYLQSCVPEDFVQQLCGSDAEDPLDRPDRLPDFARIRSTDVHFEIFEDKALFTLMNMLGAVKHSQELFWAE